MAYVADFDPTGFDQANPATWPTPGPYSPGDWWYITAPGTVDGQAVDIGDRLYPIGTGRLYGELDYGDDVYGGPVPPPPWPADSNRVRWVAHLNSAPAWNRPPPPYAGCPYIEPGWRIVLEVFYLADPATRTYGMGHYGDDVYGSLNGLGEEWVDITPVGFGAVVRRGGTDGSPVVDVETMLTDIQDLDADLFPMDPASQSLGGIVRAPGENSPIRLSLIDPFGQPYPIFSGRIERVSDEHDTPPRLVELDAFGFVVDLATTIIDLKRPAEAYTTRLANLLSRANWTWGLEPLPPSKRNLRRIDQIEQVPVRSEVDRAVISDGKMMTTNRWGKLVVSEWPRVWTGPPLTVTDCHNTFGLVSHRLTYFQDNDELLNVGIASSEEVQGAPEITAETSDGPSIGRFGRSSQTLGFPLEGLSAVQATLDELVDDAVAQYGRTVIRCASVEVDTKVDSGWFGALVDLELGQAVRTIRTGPKPLTLDHVLVGVEHRLLPDRWTATLYLSTITPTI